MLFAHTVENLADWGRVYRDVDAFLPLIRRIFRENGLSLPPVELCTPGSNAVFRAGSYLIKIFAPEPSGIGGEREFRAERFGLNHAARLGVPAPAVLAQGTIEDRYRFCYLLLEWVGGDPLKTRFAKLSPEEKAQIGRVLRNAVDRLNIPCEQFCGRPMRPERAASRWERFPLSFRLEREAFLASLPLSEDVFVHADLNPDNLLLGKDGGVTLIDFADARNGPAELELPPLLCDSFRFDADFLRGFRGENDTGNLVDRLFRGLLLHDYGADILRETVCPPEGLVSLEELHRILIEKLSV